MHRALIPLIALAAPIIACGGRADSAAGGIPCEGSAGGGMSLSERAEMVYTVAFREDSGGSETANVEAVIVARGAPGWKASARNRTATPPATAPDSGSLATSVNVAGLRLGYDRRSHAAWIHDQRVALDSFNVILVDRVDSAGGPPMVAQRLRIPPAIPLAPGACSARTSPTSMAWADSIRARLMRSPEVRTFAAP